MKLGINSVNSNQFKMSGFSRFSIGITRALLSISPDSVVYFDSLKIDRKQWSYSNVKTVNSISSFNSLTENFSRLFWSQFILPKLAFNDGVKTLYSTTPEGSTKPTFDQYITIHDLIPIKYPKSNPRLKYYYKYYLPKLIAASKGIFVTSQSTKNDLIYNFNLNEAKVVVIYQGYDKNTFCQKDINGLENIDLSDIDRLKPIINAPFLLCVAESRPYKNLERLIRAFSKVSLKDLSLIIVGRRSKHSQYLELLSESLGINKNAVFVYDLPDSYLHYLYSKATAFIFPSLYEGFGIPPLEAMACGCPVAVSRTSSLPEVCGEAAIYFDPLSQDSISEAIKSLVSNPILLKELSSKGIIQANKFSYINAATKILNVIGR